MKKFLVLVCILTASLLCTACINNLAIQELNQMGKNYLDKGDYNNAIARFQSSVDLDENVFESRYNLGVAYIKKEDYKNAIEQLKHSIEINPNSPDAYYSLAVALEAYGLQFEENLLDEENKKEYTEDEIKELLENVKEAVKMYEKYIELAPDAKDTETVKLHIEELNKRFSYEFDEGKTIFTRQAIFKFFTTIAVKWAILSEIRKGMAVVDGDFLQIRPQALEEGCRVANAIIRERDDHLKVLTKQEKCFRAIKKSIRESMRNFFYHRDLQRRFSSYSPACLSAVITRLIEDNRTHFIIRGHFL